MVVVLQQLTEVHLIYFGGSGISTTATGSSITITNDAGSASFENNFDFGAISQSILSHRDYLQYMYRC